MTGSEQKVVMDLLGLNPNSDLIGEINGFYVQPYSYYWIVTGNMPLAQANIIFDKYKPLKIRVCGNHEDYTPTEGAVSTEYINFIKECIKELHKYPNVMEVTDNKKNELLSKYPETFYIENYHIDTLEGLKVLIETIKESNIVAFKG